MAESDASPTDPAKFASFTFAYMRRVEDRLEKMMEILLRHGTQLGRIERDVNDVKTDLSDVRRDIGEVKSDIVLIENRMLTQMNQVLTIVQRIDEYEHRLDAIAPSA